MRKVSVILLVFSMLFCACSKEDDNFIRLSAQETKQYCEAIAGAYKGKGYSTLVVQEEFAKVDVIKQVEIDDVYVDIFDDYEQGIIFWDVPVNNLAYLLPENSYERKALEVCEPISFSTTYGFERTIVSIKGEKMVNLTFKPVPYYATSNHDGKNHLITIQIRPCGFYLPYTSDMNTVREEFLKSELRFDITSLKVDDKEYKNFNMVVVIRIAEESE